MSFQNIIVGVAILILIISLIVIGILIRRKQSNVKISSNRIRMS